MGCTDNFLFFQFILFIFQLLIIPDYFPLFGMFQIFAIYHSCRIWSFDLSIMTRDDSQTNGFRRLCSLESTIDRDRRNVFKSNKQGSVSRHMERPCWIEKDMIWRGVRGCVAKCLKTGEGIYWGHCSSCIGGRRRSWGSCSICWCCLLKLLPFSGLLSNSKLSGLGFDCFWMLSMTFSICVKHSVVTRIITRIVRTRPNWNTLSIWVGFDGVDSPDRKGCSP